MNVTATDAIEIKGQSPFAPTSINSFTFNAGNAGDVVITTPRLTVKEGGGVFSSTIAAGNGGRLTLNVAEALSVTGIAGLGDTSGQTRIASSATSLGGTLLQAILGLPDVSNGNSGELTIYAGRVNLNQEAVLTVSAEGVVVYRCPRRIS